ncbi:helix-turn-helix domain-containing protein [Actinopolyspora sp. H202]|uniref:helix-turn-helix domain-containing protein n=1 Tax=Actinopolyspora sp. H202 TaxID=1500456 RepID=UPI003EE48106
MSNTPPAVRRVQVGLILRNLRNAAGVSPPKISERLDWYSGKLTKVERGDLTASAAEIEVMLEMYGVADDQEQAERLRALGKEARRRDRPSTVPDWANTFLALEGASSEIKAYDPEVIPAILQTEHYARAVLSNPLDESVDPEPGVAERMMRADRALHDEGPRVWVVLGEAVLYRQIGDYQVLRDQLQHLRKMAKRSNVTIQIIPFTIGEHVALGTGWVLLTLEEPEATYVYTEALTSADYIDRPAHTDAYKQAFDRLRAAAASERETATMLDRRIKELRHQTTE